MPADATMGANDSVALSPKELRGLRARAHALKPVVWLAQRGLSEGALREIDRALDAHELVKIHAALDDRAERARLLATLCRELHAAPVQVIGKMLVAFRPRPPAAEPAPPARPRAARQPATRAGGARSAAARRAGKQRGRAVGKAPRPR